MRYIFETLSSFSDPIYVGVGVLLRVRSVRALCEGNTAEAWVARCGFATNEK